MLLSLKEGSTYFIPVDSVNEISFDTEIKSDWKNLMKMIADDKCARIYPNLNEFADKSEEGKFTRSFSFQVPRSTYFTNNMYFTSEALYHLKENHTDSGIKPIIQIVVKGKKYGQADSTIAYTIGDNERFILKQWRLPTLHPSLTTIIIKIDIPEDKELLIRNFYFNYTNPAPYIHRRDIRLNAHGSNITAPFNTYNGFIRAAKAGYPCCIAVPKRTKDGVWVCYHDDDNITNMRYSNGQVICLKTKDNSGNDIYTHYDESGNVIGQEAMPIGSLTWEFLRDKIIFQYVWTGEKIPTLEDFFSVCAKTGMAPMLSVHPGLTRSEWEEVCEIATRHGLLDKLNVKLVPTDADINPAIEVMGDQIESYTFEASTDIKYNMLISKLPSIISRLNRARIGIESTNGYITKQKVFEALELGKQHGKNLFYAAIMTDRDITGERYEELISWGVSEFTDNYNPSYGLNW